MIKKQLEKIRDELLSQCSCCDHSGIKQDKTICDCMKKFSIYASLANANIGKEYWNLTLNDFKGDKMAKLTIKQYCDNIELAYDNGLGLMLVGEPGRGKTLLAIVVLKAALEKQYSIYSISLAEVLKTIKDGFNDRSQREIFENKIKNIDFLILDDVGKEYDSRYSLIEFEALIRFRSQNNLPLIITTNLTKEETKQTYSNSLLSIFTGKLRRIVVQGEDFRKKTGEMWDRLLTVKGK